MTETHKHGFDVTRTIIVVTAILSRHKRWRNAASLLVVKVVRRPRKLTSIFSKDANKAYPSARQCYVLV